MDPNDVQGGPAFPAQFFDERATGMSLRDYFAAKAMHGLLTEPQWGEGSSASVHAWKPDFKVIDPAADRYAFAAYKIADAMIREKQRTTP